MDLHLGEDFSVPGPDHLQALRDLEAGVPGRLRLRRVFRPAGPNRLPRVPSPGRDQSPKEQS